MSEENKEFNKAFDDITGAVSEDDKTVKMLKDEVLFAIGEIGEYPKELIFIALLWAAAETMDSYVIIESGSDAHRIMIPRPDYVEQVAIEGVNAFPISDLPKETAEQLQAIMQNSFSNA